MKHTIYLVANKNGVQRMSKRVPTMGRAEVAIELAVEIPDECFRAPITKASISIPADHGPPVHATVARKRRLILGDDVAIDVQEEEEEEEEQRDYYGDGNWDAPQN